MICLKTENTFPLWTSGFLRFTFGTLYAHYPYPQIPTNWQTQEIQTDPIHQNPSLCFRQLAINRWNKPYSPGHLSTLSRCLNLKCDTLEAIQRHKKSLRRLPELPVWRRYGCLKSRLIGIILQTLLSESYWNICAIFLSKAYLFVIMPTKCKILGGWVCLSIGFKSRWPSNYRIIVMTHTY